MKDILDHSKDWNFKSELNGKLKESFNKAVTWSNICQMSHCGYHVENRFPLISIKKKIKD